MTRLATPQDAALWLHQRVRGALHTDSRQVTAGDGFIAWPGAATDGRRFVAGALAQGATACLIEQDGAEAFGFDDAAIATYGALKAASGPIAAAYYEQPSQALSVVAITGTNGKTSSAWWLAWALSKLQLPALSPSALVGTLGIGMPGALKATGLTTPDPVLLQQNLRAFVDGGVKSCVMEASSIGIAEHRLDGTAVRVAVFTNLTQDHLDYHGSIDAYWAAKAALFAWPGLQAAVINIDDPRGAQLAEHTRARGLDVWTVSLRQPARVQAQDVGYGAHGLRWKLREGAQAMVMDTALVGEYNISNLLGVIAALRALGVPLADAARVCADLPPVPGRMERVTSAGSVPAPLVVVDYAHTPDALEKALAALRPLAAQRGGRLCCVFGCGGNRDAGKRPLMGAAAQAGADTVVVTSDNPRLELPETIIEDICRGLTPAGAVHVEADRARAIRAAIEQADAHDVVLIAGKGHEDYQDAGGVKTPFSDQAHARQALADRVAAGAAA
ncbi:UDP-N-acetylmuramoyl-L-alanyl-D-glutamate--2,6-diaminopimelate ligase [Ottowia sp.]|uniref:UDP-N-acetylmuramoyl-L-alanyl-D-glutamate--2, 6-diaminopimelate ligase n=1 Tax=Ottowia sp. TaxID=1898956 RepID=UPI00394503A6